MFAAIRRVWSWGVALFRERVPDANAPPARPDLAFLILDFLIRVEGARPGRFISIQGLLAAYQIGVQWDNQDVRQEVLDMLDMGYLRAQDRGSFTQLNHAFLGTGQNNIPLQIRGLNDVNTSFTPTLQGRLYYYENVRHSGLTHREWNSVRFIAAISVIGAAIALLSLLLTLLLQGIQLWQTAGTGEAPSVEDRSSTPEPPIPKTVPFVVSAATISAVVPDTVWDTLHLTVVRFRPVDCP